MRRGLKVGQIRPTTSSNQLSRDLDSILDQWSSASPEGKLQLVFAKLRLEDKAAREKREAV
jgi:hypothetical protein